MEIDKRGLVSLSDLRDQRQKFLIEKFKLDHGLLVGKEPQEGSDELEDEEEDDTIFSAINHVHKSEIQALVNDTNEI